MIIDVGTLQFDKDKDGKKTNKLWRGWFAKPIKNLRLTFRNTLQVITNSVPIDLKSVIIHQYEFQVFRKTTFSLSDNGSNNGEIVLDEYERRNVYNKLRSARILFRI